MIMTAIITTKDLGIDQEGLKIKGMDKESVKKIKSFTNFYASLQDKTFVNSLLSEILE